PKITTLSLHDALPICANMCKASRLLPTFDTLLKIASAGLAGPAKNASATIFIPGGGPQAGGNYWRIRHQRLAEHLQVKHRALPGDRKSTRLNSSHSQI